MPKRTKKNRYMKKGGDIFAQTPPATAQGFTATAPAAPSAFSGWFNDATTAMKKAASSVGSAASSVGSAASSAANSVGSAATSATSALQNQVSPPPRFGGSRCRKGGKMVAIPTAKPQVCVGGKTRKITCNKRHKHTKSCKNKTGNRKKRSRKSKFPFSESLKRLIKM
jgi:hypothetical protein